MATTYLTLTNSVLRELNETELKDLKSENISSEIIKSENEELKELIALIS